MKSILLVLICIFTLQAYAQQSQPQCAQVLRLARSTYEQGRFHEIPALLENCLKSGEGNFTKQERVEALRILTLSYLYREEPEEADAAMLRLLNTDHFFQINEDVDPAEFTALYKTFRTKPLFSIGIKFGANTTLPTAINNYYVGGSAPNKGEYSPGYNIQYGVVFEKLLFERRQNSKWTAAPEIMFATHSFKYGNESLTTSDQTGTAYSFLDGNFIQKRLDLNLLLQYKIKDTQLNPYFTFGLGGSYLFKGTAQLETQFPSEGSVVTGPSIDLTETYKPLDYTAMVGGGVKFKFGEIYLTADVRYKYGIKNLTQESSRTNSEATFDYAFVSNDIRQSSVLLNIGFIWPYFNPKKLLK